MSTRFDADSSSQIWEHLNALDDDVIALSTPGAWADLPLAGGFAHQGANKAQYRIRSTGLVEFRWGISNTGLTASATFTIVAGGGLPAGARPALDKYFPIPGNTAANTGRINITPAGAVVVSTGATLSSYYIFDSVRYYTGS